MAYRIHPVSSHPRTQNKTFPRVLKTADYNRYIEGLGVMASLDSDAELHYVFHTPFELPTGTAKLELNTIADNGGGDAKINPMWKSVDFDESMDLNNASLNEEGIQTISWTYNTDENKIKRITVNLDADTIVADEMILLVLEMQTANWTMNAATVWLPSINWE